MSSAEEDFNDGDNLSTVVPGSKKRRVQRACDACRRKKIRCDGGQMPRNRCSNCIASSFECTYVEAAKKRGPPKGYVEGLENRLDKMEKLLQKVCPDADFSRELGGGPVERGSWQRASTSASTPGQVINTTSSLYSKTSPDVDELVPSDDEDTLGLRLSDKFQAMSFGPLQTRFFGKASGVQFIQKALDLKREATGSEPPPRFYQPREEYSDYAYPWERAARVIEEPQYILPEEDLGRKLVDLYFTQMNTLLPLLHRPTFWRKIQQGLHHHDSAFGAVYLLVCAVGSRYTDDPRVFLDDVEPLHRERSCGWKYFQQVPVVRKSLLGTPSLEDLQIYSLFVIFLHGSSAPHACWTIVGVGVRLAQDVGAHRRKSYTEKPSVESELWKRAFWVLAVLDRQLSTSLGRPCAIQDEDLDIDFPIECDDKYWEHPDPEQAFKQPPGKPSTVCFFNQYLKLNNIMSFAARTIYSINKSKILLGFVGQQWEQHIVAELDSSLNKWIDEVPDHLRWDPTRDTDSPFFTQSTLLYATYYVTQIFVHRPFIPAPRKPSPLSFPSLAICTNAARSCSHILDIYKKRCNETTYLLLGPAFTAGIVLLLNIWGGKESGLAIDPVKEMADVHKCMSVLKRCESRWHSAGRLWDILCELATVGELPLPQPSPQGTKRERDPDSPATDSRPSPSSTEASRTVTGIRRVEGLSKPQQPSQPPQQQPSPPQSAPQTYELPVYSNDLGRLPVHGQVNFSAKGPTGVPTIPSTSAVMDASNTWYPPSSDASRHPHPHREYSSSSSPHSSPVSAHDYSSPSTYPIDELYYSHMSTPFGAYSTAPVPTGSGQPHSHPSVQADIQAFMDAAVASGMHTSMLQGSSGMSDADADADATRMWSTAPPGFGVNDWGTYLSNVAHHPDGSGTSSRSSHGYGYAHHGYGHGPR